MSSISCSPVPERSRCLTVAFKKRGKNSNRIFDFDLPKFVHFLSGFRTFVGSTRRCPALFNGKIRFQLSFFSFCVSSDTLYSILYGEGLVPARSVMGGHKINNVSDISGSLRTEFTARVLHLTDFSEKFARRIARYGHFVILIITQ